MLTRIRLTQKRGSRRGAVVVLVAFSMAILLICVAIAIDGGGLLERRRKSQATADAAALAAAESLFRNYPRYEGLDLDGSAAAAARAIAAANGFANDGETSIVTVRTSPQTYSGGAKEGDLIPSGFAEVTVQYNQSRYFSRILGKEPIPVRARAVAVGKYSAADVGIHVLDLHASAALTATGESSVTVNNSGVIVNSDASDAATSTGGTLIATKFSITGGSSTSGNSGGFVGDMEYGTPPQPDPLRHVPEPLALDYSSHSKVNMANGVRTISPGVYRGGISVSGQGTLIMEPGVYYMDGGGFAFSGQGDLAAQGVMIYNAPTKSSDVVSITGTGSVQLSPPTDGLYKGLSLFQDRASSNTMTVSGGGAMDVTGTFYAAGGKLKVGGGGDSRIGSQYVSRFLDIVGNGGLTIDYDPNTVQPVRYLHLVE